MSDTAGLSFNAVFTTISSRLFTQLRSAEWAKLTKYSRIFITIKRCNLTGTMCECCNRAELNSQAKCPQISLLSRNLQQSSAKFISAESKRNARFDSCSLILPPESAEIWSGLSSLSSTPLMIWGWIKLTGKLCKTWDAKFVERSEDLLGSYWLSYRM